jgi:Carboxypeptidase regulatory-like domain/TonB dependent receptor
MRRRSLSLSLSLFSMMIFSVAINPLAFGQGGSTSSLSGSVADPTGAVIPGAQITIKNKATSAEFRAVTAGNGTFSIPALDAGTYTVTVSATGFKQAVINNVKLDAGVPGTVRVSLDVGSTSESVVVQGGGEVVQTQSANIATTLNVNQISNLPLISRNALDFVVLLPGTNTPTTARNSSINGLPDHALNITIDGINTQDNFLKSTTGVFSYITPRLDAVEEVTVSTATPGAESSGQGAIQVKFITRRGGNELHGSLYEYHRNPWLNSNYWFNNRNQDPVHKETGLTCSMEEQLTLRDKCKAPRDRVLFNQFGFRAGGPFVFPKKLFGPLGFDGRNKAFFFVNYEGFRLPNAISRQRIILTPEAQQGIFRYGQNRSKDLLKLARDNGQLATIDPVIGKLLSDIRNSTVGVGGIQPVDNNPNHQQFTFANTGNDARDFITLRLDFNLTAKHQLESAYYYEKHLRGKDILNSVDPAFPGFPNFGSQVGNRFTESLALRSTLSATMVNEARVGFTGGTVLFRPDLTVEQFNGPLANQAGFHLDIGTPTGISNATRTTNASRRNAPLWNFSDTLNWTRGAHSLSLGGSFTQVNVWVFDQTVVPEIDFGLNSNDPASSLFGPENFIGSSNADRTRAQNLYAVLTGRVISIAGNAQINEKTGQYAYLGERVQRGRMREWGFFAQDSWRVRPNLTLNYGLRWEVQFPFTPLNNSYTTTTPADLYGDSGVGNLFNPNANTGRPTQFIQFKKGDRAYNVDYSNFGPTFGFAWSPNPKSGWLKRIIGEEGRTVLRGGYAMAYTRPGIAEFSDEFGANPGSFVTATRSLVRGNLVGEGLGSLPVLLSETGRLGPAPFPSAPTFPFTGAITNGANIFDPNLKVPYVQSWSFGIQREITKNMAVEVRYVGNRGLQGWTEYNLNEVNIKDNGFLDEFKLAQKNLEIFKAANPNCSTTGNVACSFAFRGLPGQSPLPIFLAYFSGIPKEFAGDRTKYTSGLFSNPNFVNRLALNNPLPYDLASANSTFGLYGEQTRRDNAEKAGLLPNFFLVNPGLQGGSSFTGNGGYNRYDGLQVELRRRLSSGLQVQGSYVFAKSFSSQRVSFRVPRVNSLGGTLKHAFKANWVYELPIGRGRMLFGNAGSLLDRLAGGWEFHGVARIQSGQLFDLGGTDVGDVRLVGMTRRDLQKAFKLRFDNENGFIYMLPQDIIENTFKAFDVSATSPTGYGDEGVPTGRYIAPADSPSCIQVVSGDCAPQNIFLYGPKFTRFDLSAVKRFKINERLNFELRGEFLNAFNNANFLNLTGDDFIEPSSQTFGQVTTAYRDTSNTNDPGGRVIQIVLRFNF